MAVLDGGTDPQWLSTRNYVLMALGSILAWQATSVAYNLFYHPLRKYPGPLVQRASRIPWFIQFVSGVQMRHTQRLHERYGSVVRISPNHLSYTDSRAWKDIYGHRLGSHGEMNEMPKTVAFSRPIEDVPTSIINADREEHQRFRRALSNGFSDSSMRKQEPVIMKYVDLLVKRLHREGQGGEKALRMEAWYNWVTFDIVGDLVFGESFGCLQNVSYHPWVEFITEAIQAGALMTALTYMGLGWAVQLMFRVGGKRVLRDITKATDAMVMNRLAMKDERNDLFEGLVRKRDEWNLSFEKLSSNAYVLVLAGSETTATLLSGCTYLLMANPDVLKKLSKEIRSSFTTSSAINMISVQKLPYLLAVLSESLRFYPPVTNSVGLVRMVPPEGGNIAGDYVPGGTFVEVQPWSINHSKDNWTEPWEFRPERFLKDKETALASGDNIQALNPFSVGPRNCIGRNLAFAEMRLILARIIYDFDITLDQKSEQWVERQKTYGGFWQKGPLKTYLTPVNHDVVRK